jgi:putative ABC transport system permease protein
VRNALRQLHKSPGYTALAVGALALGIGANTVLFSVINTLFLRPLPYPEPEQLVRVYGTLPERGFNQVSISWPRYVAFRDQQEVFSEFSAHCFTGFNFTGRSEPEGVTGLRVSDRFFAVFGVKPLLGRTFTPAEDQPGGANVLMLSHGFWQQRFGGDPAILGQTLVLNGTPFTVIGVLPPGLGFPFNQLKVWLPRVFEQDGITPELVQRGTGFLTLTGRLKPGVTIVQANENLRLLSARYGAAQPEKVDAKAGLNLISVHEDLVGAQRSMFFTLFAAVGCVLLVACANVANLLLARFTGRRKEVAIRFALGASRARIVTQFLTESVLTSMLGGVLGLLLAVWGIDAIARVGENFIPRASDLHLDAFVTAFAVALSLLTGLLLGFVPAWQASRASAAETLKDSSRGSSGGRHASRFRSALLVAEVALSLVLLVGAALLIDSFRRLQRVDPGFRPENITTFTLGLPPAQYPDTERQAQFFEQLIARLRTLPGVTQVAGVSGLPISGGGPASPAAPDGQALPPLQERAIPARRSTTPGYFETLGIPLKAGRDFTWRDRAGTPNVVIVNESLAKRMFGTDNPLGRKLITGIASIPREVVGVVGDFRGQNLATPPNSQMFYPGAQIDGALLSIVVRSPRSAASLRAELIAAVHALDPSLPVNDVQSFTFLLAQAVADRRLSVLLLGGFAVLALVLSGMGIYSVIAYGVAQRTHEFGIRMALGAEPAAVVRLVMKEGLRLVVIGLGVGLVAAFGLTRLMSKLLYGVSATDPWVFIGVSVFLAVVTAAACLLPALKATKVDPMTALRAE